MPRKRKPRPKPVPRKITHRQQAFVREYVVDHNGTQAAIRAGYGRRSAAQQASALLRLPQVIEELGKHAAPAKERANLKASKLLEVLRTVAFGDIRNLFKPSSGDAKVSTFKDIWELGEEQVLVTGYKRRADGSVELKFADRMRAVELLMKHFGLLRDQTRLEGANELTIAEQERINTMSDAELAEFNMHNAAIHRLLYGEDHVADRIDRTTDGTAASE